MLLELSPEAFNAADQKLCGNGNMRGERFLFIILLRIVFYYKVFFLFAR